MTQSLFGKIVSPHICNCTKKDFNYFPVNRFCEDNIFGSFHSSIRTGMFHKIGLLKNFGKLTGKTPVPEFFFLEKVAQHQVCNFIKKMPHHRCFTVNFAKLLKALCRTPLVSASNFNSTFLTLRPRQTYIYVFPALRFLDISKPLHVPYRS